ncbi:hypothetical protein P0082_05465 [Candidatus Haliotispira prima]|uniref:Sigma-70 family RNA polymerase sigma factor n=1 Tax=Candidatus Haliotispira prima TaxID=3034016 RepID=A0ABY8MK12_9SPIO|nr:hypothetical protein P0082_05465 [Candidatus Haliotispira prima]
MVGEFLLEYRDSFLQALERFEQQDVTLEGYIGFILKMYRRNFHKIKNFEWKRQDKIYTNYSELKVKNKSVNSYLENRDSYLENEDLDLENQGLNIDEYVAETEYLCHSVSDPAYLTYSTVNTVEEIIYILSEAEKRYGSRSRKKLVNYKLLRILLVYNQESILDKGLVFLLKKAEWSRGSYDRMLAKREVIFERIRAKRREVKRRLQRCYLNYLAAQRVCQNWEELPESRGPARRECMEKEQHLYQTLNNLRERYFRMRLNPKLQEVSDLLQIPLTELKRYLRYLKNIMSGPEDR